MKDLPPIGGFLELMLYWLNKRLDEEMDALQARWPLRIDKIGVKNEI